MPIARCPRGCGWQQIAPTAAVARRLVAEHVVDVHTTEADTDRGVKEHGAERSAWQRLTIRGVPEGRVQVRLGDTWITTTPERARDLHDDLHT